MSWAIDGQIALADEREARDALAALERAAELGATRVPRSGRAGSRPPPPTLAATCRRPSGNSTRRLAQSGAPEAACGSACAARSPRAWPRGPWQVRITDRGRPELLPIEVSGQPVSVGAKLPRHPLELLQALIDAGGRTTAARLADGLWPGDEGGRALDSFERSLRRARALLGRGEALPLAGGVLPFGRSRVWIESGTAAPSRRVRPTGSNGATASLVCRSAPADRSVIRRAAAASMATPPGCVGCRCSAWRREVRP